MREEIINKAKILIVDDQQANVRYLERILSKQGVQQIVSTIDPREVLTLYAQHEPDLIVLDLMMPYLDGFQVMELLRPFIPEDTYLPILVLTADITAEAKRRALESGAMDFLIKPFDATEVLLRICNLLHTRYLHQQLRGQNQNLEEKVRNRTSELEDSQLEVLDRLALAAEYRDDETGQHTARVGYLSGRVAALMGLSQEQVQLISRAAPLHDVGKIGIPDDILLKPGKLSPAEFDVMKSHTLIGARILSRGRSELIRTAQLIALTHHENWDGSGYPHALSGDKIPLPGRIVAAVDVFDALTHPRPYKGPWPVEDAANELREQRGIKFDPDVVDALLLALQEDTPYPVKPHSLVSDTMPLPPLDVPRLNGAAATNADHSFDTWLNEAKESAIIVTYQQRQ